MSTYDGKPTCTCGKKWFPVFVEYLDEEYGIKVRFVQLIGAAKKSAGTHAGGLCFDLVVTDPGQRSKSAAYALVVSAARQLGADATWHRPYNWDRRKGMEHVHGLGTGCPHLAAAAKRQQAAVKNGKNGLANNGNDTGPRPLSGRTWKQGIEWAEDHMVTAADVWNWDGPKEGIPIQEPANTPEAIKKNPYWSPRSVLSTMLREQAKQTIEQNELKAEQARQRELLEQILAKLGGDTPKA